MEESERAADNFLGRLKANRGVLGAAALVLAVIAYQTQTWAAALIGWIFVAGIALAPARRMARRPRSRFAAPRAVIWPSGDIKSVCEALSHPAYVIDRTTALRYANSAAGEAFGPAKIGDPISFKFRSPAIVRLMGEAVAAGGERAMEYHDSLPSDRWYRLSMAPIPKAGHAEVDFYLLSFFDLAEAKRAEQMRSDFIANASHELRTPLASLRGFVETIKGPAANDQKAIRQFLDLMLDQAERMSRLINDLLSLSRIEMKAHVRPSDRIELTQLLRHVRDAMAPMATKYGVTLQHHLPDETVTVLGDRDELIQVFENLVENACKYGQSGKQVDLTVKLTQTAAGRKADIVIRDYGPGITAEHLPRLTERFYRVDVESSRDKQGTGLGLAIVKHILARHGTRLAVSSTPGEGASFSVTLPVADAETVVDKNQKIQIIQ